MKILHVLDHSVPLHSGYSFRTLAILREQRRLGWATAQLTSTKHEASAAALPGHRARTMDVVDGFEFHRTPLQGRLAERLPLLNHWEVVRSLRRRLADVADTFKPDVLHAHSPSLNGLATLHIARRRQLPFVYELRALWEDASVDHGTSRNAGPRYLASRSLETHVVRRADAVVTICEGLRREIIARGVAADRITVVPNGVDVGAFTPTVDVDRDLVARLGVEGHRVLGFIGSFYAYEGLRLLLEAMPAILAGRPKTKLVLVGGGFQDDALRRQVDASGLRDHVLFVGRVAHEAVRAYYGLIDVLVYPRLSMRLTELVTPLKPLEAMAYRRLVVASDVGGHRELIRDGVTGLLFRAGDASALAARVLEALALGERGAAIRASARRFVEAERAWPIAVRRYSDVYQSALRRRSLSAPGRVHERARN